MVTFYRQCLSWTNTPNSNSAVCLVVKESTLPWFHFFFWVQHQVPTFKPQCAVTDGAAGIYNAFKQATSTAPCHVVCSTRHRTEIKIWQSWVFAKEMPLSLRCREPRNGPTNQRQHYEEVPRNSFHTTISCLSKT